MYPNPVLSVVVDTVNPSILGYLPPEKKPGALGDFQTTTAAPAQWLTEIHQVMNSKEKGSITELGHLVTSIDQQQKAQRS